MNIPSFGPSRSYDSSRNLQRHIFTIFPDAIGPIYQDEERGELGSLFNLPYMRGLSHIMLWSENLQVATQIVAKATPTSRHEGTGLHGCMTLDW